MTTEKPVEGRAKGGKARASKMTAEQRKASAMKAVEAKKHKAKLPKVTHEGELKILDVVIPCYVLDTGERVLSQRGISSAFTGSHGGSAGKSSGAQKLPRFLAKASIKPFINKDLMARIDALIEFQPKSGRSAFGYEASLLPEICEVILDSGRANGETDSASYIVAETLIRGFARVGITALIDEATGYQKDRARDALAQILEAYVTKELQPWVRTFDPDYYEHMFRLRGLPYPPEKISYRPVYFGHLTNDVVYSRLAPGVLAALKEEAKKENKKGSKLFQHLTAGFGRQELLKHLGMVVGLMKLSKDWPDFMQKLNTVASRYNESLSLDLDEPDR